jgi:hypothetical protein
MTATTSADGERKRKKKRPRPMYGPWDTRTPLQKIPGNKGWADWLPTDLWNKVFFHKKQAEAKWVRDVGFVRFGDKIMCATPFGIPDTDTGKFQRNGGPVKPGAMAERLRYKFGKVFWNSKDLGWGWRGVPGASRFRPDFTLGEQNGLKRRLAPYKLKSGKQVQYVLNLRAFSLKVDERVAYETQEELDRVRMSVTYDPPNVLKAMKPWPKDQAPPRFVIDLSHDQDALERLRAHVHA